MKKKHMSYFYKTYDDSTYSLDNISSLLNYSKYSRQGIEQLLQKSQPNLPNKQSKDILKNKLKQCENENNMLKDTLKQLENENNILKLKTKQLEQQLENAKKGIPQNPYDVLGIKQDLDIKAVKQVFRQLSLIYHPDKGHTPSDELFKKYTSAYEAICKLHDKQ